MSGLAYISSNADSKKTDRAAKERSGFLFHAYFFANALFLRPSYLFGNASYL
jgi:hypothetical protein